MSARVIFRGMRYLQVFTCWIQVSKGNEIPQITVKILNHHLITVLYCNVSSPVEDLRFTKNIQIDYICVILFILIPF